MTSVLTIYDSDSVYTQRMMDYIGKKKYKGFEFRVFTNKDKLIEHMEKHNIDLLLTGDIDIDQCFVESISLKKDTHIIYLTPDLFSHEEDNLNVYKYQPIAKVISEVISIYTRLNKKNLNLLKDKDTSFKVISIFSPLANLLKSHFAWSLAEELSNYYSLLFIPMEAWPIGGHGNKGASGHELSQLIYYLKENRKDLMSIMNSNLSYHGKLSYISGMSHGFDIISLEKEEGKNLLDNLKNNTDYELVIFYFGLYTEFSQEIMTSSDTCFITIEDEEYEEQVYEEWKRQMEFAGHQVDSERYNKVEVLSLGEMESVTEAIVRQIISKNYPKVIS